MILMGRYYRCMFLVALAVVILLSGCGKSGDNSSREAPLGSPENPIKMALVPSLDTKKLITTGEKLAELLEKETGLSYKISVPTSYAAVISAMGAGTVDIGWLSPLPYVIAHDKYGVEVALTTVRNKSTKYWSAVIVRSDSGIDNLKELKGKKFAYGDPVSTSGAIYPKHLIRANGFEPEDFFSDVIYAGAHDKVVLAVYNKQVDGGAIYAGEGSDAREKVVEMLPDVLKKTRVIARSVDIPNDTVSIRKDLPEEIVQKTIEGLKKVSESDEGKIAVMSMYGIDGFIDAKDSDYDSVRKVAEAENITLEKVE